MIKIPKKKPKIQTEGSKLKAIDLLINKSVKTIIYYCQYLNHEF